MAILSIYERRESMKSKRAFMLFVTVLWIIAGITLIITLNQEDEEAVVETFG